MSMFDEKNIRASAVQLTFPCRICYIYKTIKSLETTQRNGEGP